jgi:hypothetical protein
MRDSALDPNLLEASISETRRKLLAQEIDPKTLIESASSRRNLSPGRNTYLATDDENIQQQLDRLGPLDGAPLAGIPISLKDCFELCWLSNQLRIPILSGTIRDSHRRFCGCETNPVGGRNHHRKDPPQSIGLRFNWRKPGFWKLSATGESDMADRWLQQRGCRQCFGRLGYVCTRNGYRRLDTISREPLRVVWFSSIFRSWLVEGWPASGRII